MSSALSIRIKLSASMLLLTVGIAVVAIVARSVSSDLSSGIHGYGDRYMPALSAILNADRDLYQAREGQLLYRLEETDAARAQFDENAQQAYDRMQKYLDLMKDQPQIINKLSGFQATYNSWLTNSRQWFSMVDEGKTNQALAFSQTRVKTSFAELRKLYDLAGEELDTLSLTSSKDIVEAGDQHIQMASLLVLVLLAIATTLTWVIPKMLVEAIEKLTKTIRAIASGGGDLSQRIRSSRTDELGDLARAMDVFMDQLSEMIRSLKSRSQVMAAESNRLEQSASSSQEVVAKQEDAVHTIVVAVEEFGTAIQEVASNTQICASAAADSLDQVHRGSESITGSVQGMRALKTSVHRAEKAITELAEQSTSITDVLNVIRGIAEQTNLLALNAAIEAARAGEHGRGFAVVSDEVRTLASRTQSSTEEIQAMVERLQAGVSKAVSSVAEGSKLASDTANTVESMQGALDNIEQSATQVNEMTLQIAAAAEEQSQVANEINRNLTQIREANRDASQLQSDTRKIATEFRNLSSALDSEVSRFKVSQA